MLNETYRAMLGNKSVIRETFMYGKQRAAEIGYENVFDYSLGNPSVPCLPCLRAYVNIRCKFLPRTGRGGRWAESLSNCEIRTNRGAGE